MFRALRTFTIATCLFLGAASTSTGQVVQLPTFTSFSIGTTVIVPDRGMTYLGGVTRAHEGSSTFGPLGLNRGLGRELSRSDAGVSATIIDLRELDEAVLAEAARRRAAREASRSPSERTRQAERAEVERKAARLNRLLQRRE